jgi:hypothetical protein
VVRLVGLALVGVAVAVAFFPGRGVAATPVVTITPSAGASGRDSFTDGETVTVSVANNSIFKPGAKVNILECADPNGTEANLPKDIGSCDGLTIQGDTVLIQPGGAISFPGYTIYRLPSLILGEQSNAQPVCDGTDECVLYVGENQNDFTQPKLFSSPFTVSAAAGASSLPPAAPSTATSSTPTTVSASGASGGNAQGSLAFTGSGSSLLWLLAGGGVLLLAGGAGRRWTRADP